MTAVDKQFEGTAGVDWTPAHSELFAKLRQQAGARGFTYLGRTVPAGSTETAQQVQARLPAGELEAGGQVEGMVKVSPNVWRDAVIHQEGMADAMTGAARSHLATVGVSDSLAKGLIAGLGRKGPGLADAAFSLEGIFNFLDTLKSARGISKSTEFAARYTGMKRHEPNKTMPKAGEDY